MRVIVRRRIWWILTLSILLGLVAVGLYDKTDQVSRQWFLSAAAQVAASLLGLWLAVVAWLVTQRRAADRALQEYTAELLTYLSNRTDQGGTVAEVLFGDLTDTIQGCNDVKNRKTLMSQLCGVVVCRVLLRHMAPNEGRRHLITLGYDDLWMLERLKRPETLRRDTVTFVSRTEALAAAPLAGSPMKSDIYLQELARLSRAYQLDMLLERREDFDEYTQKAGLLGPLLLMSLASALTAVLFSSSNAGLLELASFSLAVVITSACLGTLTQFLWDNFARPEDDVEGFELLPDVESEEP